TGKPIASSAKVVGSATGGVTGPPGPATCSVLLASKVVEPNFCVAAVYASRPDPNGLVDSNEKVPSGMFAMSAEISVAAVYANERLMTAGLSGGMGISVTGVTPTSGIDSVKPAARTLPVTAPTIPCTS